MNATLPGSSLKDFARVLSCFSRVGDEVSLEVTTGKVRISPSEIRPEMCGQMPIRLATALHDQLFKVSFHSDHIGCDAIRAIRVLSPSTETSHGGYR